MEHSLADRNRHPYLSRVSGRKGGAVQHRNGDVLVVVDDALDRRTARPADRVGAGA